MKDEILYINSSGFISKGTDNECFRNWLVSFFTEGMNTFHSNQPHFSLYVKCALTNAFLAMGYASLNDKI